MTTYKCTDGYGETVEIEADSPEEAAEEYVDDGCCGDITSTVWFSIHVTPLDANGDGEWIDVEIDPPEPPCSEGHKHEWKSPYSVVGGLRENPGVYGHGAGTVSTEVCVHCGAYRVIDTWATNPENGVQGLTSTSFRNSDEASLAWVERRQAELA